MDRQCVEPQDLLPLLSEVVRRHPALVFLHTGASDFTVRRTRTLTLTRTRTLAVTLPLTLALTRSATQRRALTLTLAVTPSLSVALDF